MMRIVHPFFAAVAALLVSAGAALAASSFVVIDSSAPAGGLATGQVVALNDTIELPEGSEAVLLAEDGSLVRLLGPFSGTMADEGEGVGDDASPTGLVVLSKIAKLVSKQETTKTLGVSRAIGDAGGKAVPNAKLLSVGRSGARCIVSAVPELWRANASAEVVVQVSDEQGQSEAVTWPAGSDRVVVPPQFVRDRTKLAVRLAGKTVDLTLHLRPDEAHNLADVLAWMADSDCTDQAAALLSSIRGQVKSGE